MTKTANAARRAIAVPSGNREPGGSTGHAAGASPFPRRGHFDAMARKTASRAMSVREWTSSFFRMWET